MSLSYSSLLFELEETGLLVFWEGSQFQLASAHLQQVVPRQVDHAVVDVGALAQALFLFVHYSPGTLEILS